MIAQRTKRARRATRIRPGMRIVFGREVHLAVDGRWQWRWMAPVPQFVTEVRRCEVPKWPGQAPGVRVIFDDGTWHDFWYRSRDWGEVR